MSFRGFSAFNRRGKGDFKLFGKGRRSDFYIEKLPGPEDFDITDDTEDRIANIIDDRAAAKRVRLLQMRYPVASLPELVVMDWLTQKRIPFRFQVPIAGGRSRSGGQILDFTTHAGSGILVMRVMGYYHELPTSRRIDEAQRLALRQMKVEGQPVVGVIDLWERRILDEGLREPTMQAALAGRELGR